jgi:methyl halide transferase
VSFLDAAYWNNRYLNDEFSWDLGEVSPPLKAYFDQLQNKELRILIPGAGNAYEAEYLVNKGFSNVYVCDIAMEPLKNLAERCPAFKEQNLLHVDFFSLETKFDLVIEQTFFCALHPSLRKKYFEKMSEILNDRGQLAGLLFDDRLNDDKPPFGGSREEYISYFKDLFRIKAYDTCYNSIKPRAGRELFILLEKLQKN